MYLDSRNKLPKMSEEDQKNTTATEGIDNSAFDTQEIQENAIFTTGTPSSLTTTGTNSSHATTPTCSTSDNSKQLSCDYTVYKRRWYVLGVFSTLSMLQCTVWNQFGPIYESMKIVFNWDDTQVALMPFYGTLTFTIFVMPAVFLTERWGARLVVLIMSLLVSAALLLRCIKIDDVHLQTILINISGILNGIAGATTIYVPTVISAQWFPACERKLATSLGIIFNVTGILVSFLVGALVVPVPKDDSPESRLLTFDRYFYLTFAEAGVAVVISIAVLAYFPSEPPSPPSRSAGSGRVTAGASLREVFGRRDFWTIGIPVVLMFASYQGWQPVLGICLEANGVGQSHAGWMGIYSALGSLLLGPIVGKVADVFPRNSKAISLALSFLALEGVVFIFVLNQNYVKFNLNAMYFGVILSGTASGALMPLACEFAVDVCYPIAEPTVSGLIGGAMNAVICVFLAIVFVPHLNLAWMTWFLLVAWGLAFPMMLVWPTHFARSMVDDDENE